MAGGGQGVRVRYDLTIDLQSVRSTKAPAPVLCGVEVVAEGWENPPPPEPKNDETADSKETK